MTTVTVTDVPGLEITSADWRHPLRCNPHYLTIRRAANEWFLSYRPFETEEMNAYFVESDVPYLASVCLPGADRVRLRNCCDMMALFIYRDDEFDAAGGDERRDMIATAFHALRDGSPRTGKWSTPFQDAWRRFAAGLSGAQRARFVDSVEDYLAGCQRMTTTGPAHSVDSYLAVRRSSIGERIDLLLIEYALGIDIAADDLDRPLLRRVQNAHLDVVIAIQDLLSFRKEAQQDHTENLLTCIRHNHRCSLAEAVGKAHDLLRARAAEFDDACRETTTTSWGKSAELAAYLEGLRDFTSGVAAWTAHSVRYTHRPPATLTRA